MESQDCVPNSQSKPMSTQLGSPGMAASTNGERDDTVMIPAHNDNVLDQEIPEGFTYPYFDPYSTLAIQASADPYQLLEPELTSAGGQTSQIHIPGSICPFDFELEKLRKEEENSSKTFDTKRSELNAELKRKIAEAEREYDGKVQELDAEYNLYAMENNTSKIAVERNILLANAFVSTCTDPSAATNLRSVRARTSQYPIQQWQGNPNMNSTASPPVPNQSGPLFHFPRYMTQPMPLSQQPQVQSNTHINSTALSLPSVPAKALSPLSNMTQPRPPPLISNQLIPYPSPSAYGIVRTPAPHLQGYRGSRVPNASATYRRMLAQGPQTVNWSVFQTTTSDILRNLGRVYTYEDSHEGNVYIG